MLKLTLLTLLSLLAFAGNSVLCRMALTDNVIDAASFTSIRLLSGIVFLLFIVSIKTKKRINIRSGRWLSSLYLYLYAIAFSYAYISLGTGAGALILFGSVQITMIVFAMVKGKRLHFVEWIGFLLALLGLYILLSPGAQNSAAESHTSLIGFALMIVSGIAWGFYTLAGKGSSNPLEDTANNFLRTLPFIVLTILVTYSEAQISSQGIILAIASGAIMSAMGYAIWYSVLPALTVTQAAVIQLTVPIIAALGGVIFSNEVITMTLMSSSALVLGGVLVVIMGKQFVGKFAK